MSAGEDGFEIVFVFVFCGVEENQVKGARGFRVGRDCFGGVAEDLGDVGGEAGSGEVFCGFAVAQAFVRFDRVKVAFGVRREGVRRGSVRERFGHPNSTYSIACADFKDGFCIGEADKLVEEEAGFGGDVPKNVRVFFKFGQ